MDEQAELKRRADEAEIVRRDAAMSIDETAQRIRDNLTELKAQRDELLAACKAAWGYLPRNSDAAEDVFQKVNAAIKRVEGKE